EYIGHYNAHNARVREFFRTQNAEHVFLEVCWENGDAWPELSSFLNLPAPSSPFPHTNATAGRKWKKSREVAHRAAARLYAAWHGRQMREDSTP
ncbi:MAG TPA: sulfotransferase, partial [Kiloniellaceae bacterium]|nr:sulfotransferase [Kiloniellaceae bacterium]